MTQATCGRDGKLAECMEVSDEIDSALCSDKEKTFLVKYHEDVNLPRE